MSIGILSFFKQRKKHIILVVVLFSALCGCSKKDVSPSDDTVELKIGAYFDLGITPLINRYNQSQDDIHVSLVDYSKSGGETLMHTELMSGKGCDLYVVDTHFSAFGGSNLFVDLLPYLSEDSDIQQTDFVPSLIDAILYDGALYQIPYGFGVVTFSGPDTYFDGLGITLDDVNQVMQNHTYIRPMLPNYTAKNIITQMSSFCHSLYIDMDSHSSSFNSQEFIETLRFCKSIADAETCDEEDTLLLKEYVLDPGTGPGVGRVFTGFPGSSGNGSRFIFGAAFSISAHSPNQDAAWDFLRFCISKEQQDLVNETGFYLPIRKDVLSQQVEEAYQERALSEHDIQQFWTLIEQTTNIGGNSDVQDIIIEEATIYFADRLTAEQAAENIQSRVSILLAELRN